MAPLIKTPSRPRMPLTTSQGTSRIRFRVFFRNCKSMSGLSPAKPFLRRSAAEFGVIAEHLHTRSDALVGTIQRAPRQVQRQRH